jgi:hypothetical protein
MKRKVDELNKAIRDKACELGLIFVNGPDLTSVQGVHPSYNTTNNQQRAVYLFGVAEVI